MMLSPQNSQAHWPKSAFCNPNTPNNARKPPAKACDVGSRYIQGLDFNLTQLSDI